MKQPRDTRTGLDLTTLLDPKQLALDTAEDDCFGKEWDPTDKDCAICHDVEICGIVKQQTIETRKKKIEKEKGPFLDMTAFEKVPIEKIALNMKQFAEDEDPATLEELEDTIAGHARTKDTVAIREYIKNVLPRYNLRVTEDKTIEPYESNAHNLNARSPLIEEDSFPGTKI